MTINTAILETVNESSFIDRPCSGHFCPILSSFRVEPFHKLLFMYIKSIYPEYLYQGWAIPRLEAQVNSNRETDIIVKGAC